ncbi:MAG TPA: DUF6776 family protein [Casimicrobiaceae bacterium]
MAVSPVWRRVARHFSISAPRMAVRTHLGWPWRALLGLLLAALVAGMWWWGFDFGQLLGGFDRKAVEQQIVAMQEETKAARDEAVALRARNAQLESELAIAQGTQATLARHVAEMQRESAAMKEELSFLQTFFDGAAKPGLAIQRLAVDTIGGDMARYSLLVVRGGNPKGEFEGHVALAVDLLPVAGTPEGTAAQTLVLAEDGGGANALQLRFRYYQRLEGTFRVPTGYAVRAVTARAYEAGAESPLAAKAVTLP